MNKRLVLSLCLFSVFGHAQNNIETLKVAEDVVYFSTTEAKAHISPNCMNAANNDIWTMPLNTVTGKASYAMLVASLEKNRPITVEPANDCTAIAEYERASSITLGPATQSPGQSLGVGYEVTTFLSGSIRVPKNTTGILAQITPPAGQRVKLTSLGYTSTSGRLTNVSIRVGQNVVVDNFTLVGGTTHTAGTFSIYGKWQNARTGSFEAIYGGENETIEISTTSSDRYYDVYYAYEFFAIE